MAYYLNYNEKEAILAFSKNIMSEDKSKTPHIATFIKQGRGETYYRAVIYMKSAAESKIEELINDNNTYRYGQSYSKVTGNYYGGHRVNNAIIREHIEFVDGNFCSLGDRRTINFNN